MSVTDLEARLRRLKLAEPAPDLGERVLETALSMHRLGRQLRLAWGAAAAAALLAVAVSWREPVRTVVLVPMPEIPTEIAEIDPGLARRAQFLAMAAPKGNAWKAFRNHLETTGDIP